MKLRWRAAVGVTAVFGIIGIILWIRHIDHERTGMYLWNLSGPASQSDIVAKMKLVRFYDAIKDVPDIYKVAVNAAKDNWSLQAAELGDAEAQAYVGSNCFYSRSDAESVRWFRLAAEQGNARGQCGLGMKYASGKGVPQDYTESAKWLRLAADQGDKYAQWYLGNAYYGGRGVPQDYKEAAKWYRRAADQGWADAQCALGVVYFYGFGVPQDDTEAVKWLRLAAEKGDDADGQSSLGCAYFMGKGVSQDYKKAVKWFRRGAENGSAGARAHLGLAYALGKGVPQDYVEAYAWVSNAAAGKSDYAAKLLPLIANKMTSSQIAEGQRRMWKVCAGSSFVGDGPVIHLEDIELEVSSHR